MLGRAFNLDQYRYGMNGQENDAEITGNIGTHTSAEYWEYDTRLGRRWNQDPVVKPWESPYTCFNNNPIYFADPLGLDGEPTNKQKQEALDLRNQIVRLDEDDTPTKSGGSSSGGTGRNSPNNTPNWHFSLGNTFSLPNQKNGNVSHPTMIYSNDGSFYNTDIVHPTSLTDKGEKKNDLTEGDHWIQVMKRLGDTHIQSGVLMFKEKKHADANGFGHEAPSPFQNLWTYDFSLINNDRSGWDGFGLNFNVGIGIGAMIGAPRLNGKNYPGGGPNGYRVIGSSSTLIARLDFSFLHNAVFSIMATATHVNLTGYSGAPVGSQGGSSYNTLSVKAAVGVNLYRRK